MELTTRRFLLSDFNDTDADAFEAYHNDPRSHEFYGTDHTPPEHARKLLELFEHGQRSSQGPIFSLRSFGVETLKHLSAVVACEVPVRKRALRS